MAALERGATGDRGAGRQASSASCRTARAGRRTAAARHRSAIRCSAIRPTASRAPAAWPTSSRPSTSRIHRVRGRDLPVQHGDSTWRLPVPAVFVVDRPGARIAFAFTDVDPARWPDPEELLALVARARRCIGAIEFGRQPAFQSRDGDAHGALQRATQESDTCFTAKTAIVTGSTSGIGLGIAEAFARAGANVVLNGFGDAMQIEKTRSGARPVQQRQGRLFAGRHEQAQGDRAHGAPDCRHVRLRRHHGEQRRHPACRADRRVSRRRSGTRSSPSTCPRPSTPPSWCCPACAPRAGVAIINVASAHALVASPYKSAYVAAKHGVLGLTKVTALETAEDGITCNAICPGYVRTPLVEKQIDDQAKAHGIARDKVISDVLLKDQPNKRFVEVSRTGGSGPVPVQRRRRVR